MDTLIPLSFIFIFTNPTMDTLMLLLSLFLSLSVFIIRYLFDPSPSVKLPPSPRKLPIIGHLHLLSDMPHHSLSQLANKLGPILHLQLGRVPTLVISSPKLAREILKTIAAQYISFGCSDVTFSAYGPYWRQTRKICFTELLSPIRVNSFRLVRDEEVNRLLVSLSAVLGSDTDMSERFFGLANNILCRVAFGRRFSDEGGKNRLNEILTETQKLLAGFSVADFFPGLEWVNALTGLKGRLERNLRMLCDEIIGEHLSADKRSVSEHVSDFVDVLLRVQKLDDLEVAITDDNLKALVRDMFVVGTDTTLATLEWTMAELARHPRVMKKVQEEIRKMAGTEGQVEEDDLTHLHYMKAVVKETLRLHPPVPLIASRVSMEKYVLDIYKIPAKARVLINTYAIGCDPETWDKPLEFYPERFIGSNMDIKGQDFELLPFGGGRRGCPGYTLGLATIELSLARLLYHFDWALPRGIGAEDVDLGEIFGLATRKKAPLVLVPTINKDYEFKGAVL